MKCFVLATLALAALVQAKPHLPAVDTETGIAKVATGIAQGLANRLAHGNNKDELAVGLTNLATDLAASLTGQNPSSHGNLVNGASNSGLRSGGSADFGGRVNGATGGGQRSGGTADFGGRGRGFESDNNNARSAFGAPNRGHVSLENGYNGGQSSDLDLMNPSSLRSDVAANYGIGGRGYGGGGENIQSAFGVGNGGRVGYQNGLAGGVENEISRVPSGPALREPVGLRPGAVGSQGYDGGREHAQSTFESGSGGHVNQNANSHAFEAKEKSDHKEDDIEVTIHVHKAEDKKASEVSDKNADSHLDSDYGNHSEGASNYGRDYEHAHNNYGVGV